MTDKRPMNVEKIVYLAHALANELDQTNLVSIYSHDGTPSAHVYKADALRQIAPQSEWTWGEGGIKSPHEAGVMVGGVRFFAIFTDEEKAVVGE